MRHKSLTRTIFQPMAIAIALGFLARAMMHIYAIPSDSMAPTLQAGDQIVVTPYFRGAPKRGDVVVFESLLVPDELMVKRVVAVPGDLVDSRLGRVRVGGYTLPEPYVLQEGSTGAVSAQLVPADSYFVLGDNRDDSLDSRSWGVVPHSSIVGRARMVLWSSSSTVGEAARAAAMSDGAHGHPLLKRSSLFKWIE
jgi:signal peptidase I